MSDRAASAFRRFREARQHDAALVAAIADYPPAEWFDDPQLDGPTPLTVTDDGRVFGHVAAWGTCHIGNPRGPNVCVPPPRNPSGRYPQFHLGSTRVEEGYDLDTGLLTFDTGHAGLTLNAGAAARHYDDTGTQAADIRVGEDKHGIWLAGALRSTVTNAVMRMIRASKVSGDWRGKELVGALLVNIPGFPIPRPEARMVASGELLTAAGDPAMGECYALVAAGIVVECDCDAGLRMQELADMALAPEERARRIELAAAKAEGLQGLAALAAAGSCYPRKRRRALTAAGWDPSKHPRHPVGVREGGRFRDVGGVTPRLAHERTETNYYSTREDAAKVRDAIAGEFPDARVVEYDRGFAVQMARGGNYVYTPKPSLTPDSPRDLFGYSAEAAIKRGLESGSSTERLKAESAQKVLDRIRSGEIKVTDKELGDALERMNRVDAGGPDRSVNSMMLEVVQGIGIRKDTPTAVRRALTDPKPSDHAAHARHNDTRAAEAEATAARLRAEGNEEHARDYDEMAARFRRSAAERRARIS